MLGGQMAKIEVKCPWCGEKFDRNNPENKYIYENRRYYHEACYQEKKEKEKDSDKTKIAEIKSKAAQWLGDSINYAMVTKQINSYLKDGWSYQEIYNALVYWIDVRQEGPQKANGGIAILNYIRKDSAKYWENQKKMEEQGEEVKGNLEDYISFRHQERVVPSKRYKIQRPKRTNFFELD
jgi:uncharacterized protein (DUF2225 family)